MPEDSEGARNASIGLTLEHALPALRTAFRNPVPSEWRPSGPGVLLSGFWIRKLARQSVGIPPSMATLVDRSGETQSIVGALSEIQLPEWIKRKVP